LTANAQITSVPLGSMTHRIAPEVSQSACESLPHSSMAQNVALEHRSKGRVAGWKSRVCRPQPRRVRGQSESNEPVTNEKPLQATLEERLVAVLDQLTERGGFEPPVRFRPHTAFPVLLLQPLGHLSRLNQI
jgi:hypothetical protein